MITLKLIGLFFIASLISVFLLLILGDKPEFEDRNI